MKLALLDKDGTLVRPRSGEQFPITPDDQELLPGVSEKVSQIHADGYMLVVVSNQGGVGMGYKSIEFAIAEFRRLMELLPQIDSCYFCPTMDGGCFYIVYSSNSVFEDCRCKEVGPMPGAQFRKPDPGMLDFALVDYKADKHHSLMIGNSFEDAKAADSAGVQFIHVAQWTNKKIPRHST